MQSPDECLIILINNTKRVGKAKLYIYFIILAHVRGFSLFICSNPSHGRRLGLGLGLGSRLGPGLGLALGFGKHNSRAMQIEENPYGLGV